MAVGTVLGMTDHTETAVLRVAWVTGASCGIGREIAPLTYQQMADDLRQQIMDRRK